MLEVLLERVGCGEDSELALADWLEEQGQCQAATLARSLRGWEGDGAKQVLEGVRKAGGERAVRLALPWQDRQESMRLIRKMLGSRRWSVVAGPRESIRIEAAPSRSLRGRMTTVDWDALERKFWPVREHVQMRGWYEVIVPASGRRVVLEMLRAAC